MPAPGPVHIRLQRDGIYRRNTGVLNGGQEGATGPAQFSSQKGIALQHPASCSIQGMAGSATTPDGVDACRHIPGEGLKSQIHATQPAEYPTVIQAAPAGRRGQCPPAVGSMLQTLPIVQCIGVGEGNVMLNVYRRRMPGAVEFRPYQPGPDIAAPATHRIGGTKVIQAPKSRTPLDAHLVPRGARPQIDHGVQCGGLIGLPCGISIAEECSGWQDQELFRRSELTHLPLLGRVSLQSTHRLQ